ncbi:Hypothetical predicted protein [Pelobates cultripes]|uniref:Uncharacterized protein n=1 Tax=Pelobates cultripes TaxID=61616 RepID=A0AAD1VW18_PELCU|nr:Hypothetical predicted protein [Pelobates cultripes]
MQSWKPLPTRATKRPPDMGGQMGGAQGTLTYDRGRRRPPPRPELQALHALSYQQVQPKQPRTAQCPPLCRAQTPPQTFHHTPLSVALPRTPLTDPRCHGTAGPTSRTLDRWVPHAKLAGLWQLYSSSLPPRGIG